MAGNKTKQPIATAAAFVTALLLAALPASSEYACHGYITGYDSYKEGVGPEKIECSENPYGNSYGSSSHQESSCCSGEGRYFVQTGQIGGFDAGYASTTVDHACTAYVNALSATLCSPRQGSFVSASAEEDGYVLTVCDRACDAVFRACGGPGENFPDWAEYTDGPSLCYEMFGGFGADTPCDGRLEGYPCQAGLRLEVAEDNCIDIIDPTEEDLDSLKNKDTLPEADVCTEDDIVAGIILLLLILLCCGGCCTGIVCCCLRRNRLQSQFEPSAATTTGGTANGNGAPPQEVIQIDATKLVESVPVAAAVPVVVNSSTVEVPGSDVDPSAPLPPPVNPSFVAATVPIPPAPKPAVSLLTFMESSDSYGRPNVVKQWMAENPTQAASLTPNDVALALSRVTFSLEQPDVAREIASGIDRAGGKLTCDHILAAVRQCRNQDADVAKAMAPFASDPHNKETVLSEFRYAFQKDELEKCFRP